MGATPFRGAQTSKKIDQSKSVFYHSYIGEGAWS